METNYHKDHLACKNCDKKLIACRYILKEEHPYCIPCYQELFAHNCEECKKPIGPDYKVGKFVVLAYQYKSTGRALALSLGMGSYIH